MPTNRLYRLPGIPNIAACFIEADIEDIASYYRGEAAFISTTGGLKIYEVRGEGARIGHSFGYDAGRIVNPYLDPASTDWIERKRIAHQEWVLSWLPDRYPLRGSVRLSRVRSNSRLTLVEFACNRRDSLPEATLQC